jgi:putative Mg2+ transporter-C (MgtC) family protein
MGHRIPLLRVTACLSMACAANEHRALRRAQLESLFALLHPTAEILEFIVLRRALDTTLGGRGDGSVVTGAGVVPLRARLSDDARCLQRFGNQDLRCHTPCGKPLTTVAIRFRNDDVPTRRARLAKSASDRLPGMAWTDEVALLSLALVLSTVVGLERELRQKSAGLRTHALVGTGAAVFVLVSKFGFSDVISAGTVTLDPSRVAAQVVSGIGFIGAGVIFVKRAGVRGLTTAATIWLTAGIGMAAGAGLVAIALAATAAHLIVAFVYTPLGRRLPQSRRSRTAVEVSYKDQQGVLRRLLSQTTAMDYVISDLDVERSDADRGLVIVRFDVEGLRASVNGLVETLEHLDGVIEVRAGESAE